MTGHPLPTPAEQARSHLLAEIARIRDLLDAYDEGRPAEDVPAAKRSKSPAEPFAERLGLSGFECDVLLLLAAVELDSEIASLVARLKGSEDPRPTFALAFGALPDPHWDAMLPQRPLRRWGIVNLGPGTTKATRPMLLDEDALHAITGLDGGAAEPSGVPCAPVSVPALTAGQQQLADELANAVVAVGGRVLVRLDGDDVEARIGVAARLAAMLGLNPLLVRANGVPADGETLSRMAKAIDREALLHDRLPVLPSLKLAAVLDRDVVVVLDDSSDSSNIGLVPVDRSLLARTIDVPAPTEQLAIWQAAMPDDAAADVASALAELAQHYRLTVRTVADVVGEWSALGGSVDELRRLTRERARVNLGVLAERIDPRVGWNDLVVPDGQALLLRDLARQVRHRAQVYEEWGFAAKGGRGLAVTALFAGDSGTGKTMAAEVIASELGLDLYRVDLSAVVSKYIGETEKNLCRLFDAAEASGAVLLFDEADALFGKRSDVKDSHDRYANLEVAYLLQRMEAYRGLAILTTNLRTNVDSAFMRRLRFVVQFPFPDESLREQIWRRVFPPDTPTDGLDASALARMQVSGGSIRSIALGAAFAAADAGTPVRPEHVLYSARVEYAKAQRTLTDTETASIGGAR